MAFWIVPRPWRCVVLCCVLRVCVTFRRTIVDGGRCAAMARRAVAITVQRHVCTKPNLW